MTQSKFTDVEEFFDWLRSNETSEEVSVDEVNEELQLADQLDSGNCEPGNEEDREITYREAIPDLIDQIIYNFLNKRSNARDLPTLDQVTIIDVLNRINAQCILEN